MSIKLIIFDLDGTLIDSSIDITNALNYAIEPYGFKPLTTQDTIKMVGEGITRLIEKLLAEHKWEVKNFSHTEIQSDVTRRFLDHYTEHILDNTRQYPGVKETLEKLNNYKKAVISNKRESLSRMVLDGLGLSRFFDIIVGSDTTQEKKPSPLPILKVLSDLHVQPADAVMVGDSNLDIDAGRAAGVTTIAVTYGYRPIELIRHAEYMIDRLADLVALLEKINNRDKLIKES
ncbi:MAG: HAD family hydrolase [Thermodesulfovibrionales bacterium]